MNNIRKDFLSFISHISSPKGFSLIELLVVAGVFVTISTIILSIFVIALRGSQKSEYLLTMKQNGNFASSQMVKQIRYAESIVSPSSCLPTVTQSSITIASLANNGQTTFSCPTSPSEGIASNSASLIDTNRVAVASCSFTCTQQTLSDPPTVTIRFTLTPKGTNALFENTGSIPFETSVTLRNFNR